MTVWTRSMLAFDGDTILGIHQTLEGALARHAEHFIDAKDSPYSTRNHAWVIGTEGEWMWVSFADPTGRAYVDYEIRELVVDD